MANDKQQMTVRQALEALEEEAGLMRGPGGGGWKGGGEMGAHWLIEFSGGERDAWDCGAPATHLDDMVRIVQEAKAAADAHGYERIALVAYATVEVSPEMPRAPVTLHLDVAESEGGEALEPVMYAWGEVRQLREEAVNKGFIPPGSLAGLPPPCGFMNDGIVRTYRDPKARGRDADVLAPEFQCSPYEQPWPYSGLQGGDGSLKRRLPIGVTVDAPDGAEYEVDVHWGGVFVKWDSDDEGDLRVEADHLPNLVVTVVREGAGEGDAILSGPCLGNAIRVGGPGEGVRMADGPGLGMRLGADPGPSATPRPAGPRSGKGRPAP